MKIFLKRQLHDPMWTSWAAVRECLQAPWLSPEKDELHLQRSGSQGPNRRFLVVGSICLVVLGLVSPVVAQNDRIQPSSKVSGKAAGDPDHPSRVDPFFDERKVMINEQVRRRGIDEPDVLQAMEVVPRHLFVDRSNQPKAYSDSPVSIAPGQTMSQAYVSARMIALLGLEGEEKVLEVGTGSGYDAALLSRLAREVFTIEIDQDLGSKARRVLGDLGYRNVKVKIADGYRGWPEEAPFDAILVTTAPEHIPQPLVDQLKVGGRMVIAVGKLLQDLQVVTKTAPDEYMVRKVSLVNLTPMQGEIRQEN